VLVLEQAGEGAEVDHMTLTAVTLELKGGRLNCKVSSLTGSNAQSPLIAAFDSEPDFRGSTTAYPCGIRAEDMISRCQIHSDLFAGPQLANGCAVGKHSNFARRSHESLVSDYGDGPVSRLHFAERGRRDRSCNLCRSRCAGGKQKRQNQCQCTHGEVPLMEDDERQVGGCV